MEKKIGSYETMFIVNPQLSEDDTKAIVAKFTALMAENGEIEMTPEEADAVLRDLFPEEEFDGDEAETQTES